MSSKYIEKHIKFTEEQYAIVSKKAEELGLRVGAYMKKMAIQGEIKRYDLSELWTIVNKVDKKSSKIHRKFTSA